MLHRFLVTVATAAVLTVLPSAPAAAQQKPQPAKPTSTPPPQSGSVQVGGFAMLGWMTMTASESFDTIVGSHASPIYGGGARIGLPWGGLFAEVGAWRYHESGERVFVSNGTTFPLGIHSDVTMTPLELSAGWRFRVRKRPRLTPYAGGGYTSMRYQETADFSASGDDVDENFNGFHVFGGAEYKVSKWLGLAAEADLTDVPNAIGESGVSSVFNEDNLGGFSFRFKLTIGR